MNAIDNSVLRVATLPDTEEDTKEIAATRAMYQPGVLQATSLAIVSNTSASAAIVSPAATPGEITIPNADQMPCYVQQGNSCGTTTLAEIMTYLLGTKITQADVDSVIRRMNTFTAPEDMIQYARDRGLSAEGYNNGSWEDLKAQIDAGHPVQCFVEGDSSVSVTNGTSSGKFSVDGMHYIAITGHGTDPATGEEYVIYHDPNRDSEQRMSVSDFEKMWGNTPFGYHNYYNAYAPNGTKLPDGNNDGIQGTQGTANGVTNITNGIDRITSMRGFGSEWHGVFETVGGVVQTVFCGVSAGLQLGAQWLNSEVDGIPVLQNIVKPFGDVVNGAAAGVADVFNGIGDSFNDFGDSIEKLCDGDFSGCAQSLGKTCVDTVEGAVDSVKDTVGSVVDSIGDLFSW
jgi:predicted double-glycine peptidase